jgi:tricorn protease-like protein
VTATDPFFSEPAIAGGRLVIVCDSAVWECALAGGAAVRRTSRFAAIAAPILHANDGRLAFAAADDRVMQVRIASRSATRSRQITFETESCRPIWFARDGRIAIVSAARSAFRHQQRVWLLDPESGAWDSTSFGEYVPPASPHTAPTVAACPGVPPRFWRGYRGGARGQIGVDATGQGAFARIAQLNGNIATPVWCRGRVYFVSDNDGHPNLFSCAPDGTDVVQLTHETRWAVHSPATDGRSLVYCCGGRIIRLRSTGKHTVVPIVIPDSIAGWRRTKWHAGVTHSIIGGPSRLSAAHILFSVTSDHSLVDIVSRRSGPVAKSVATRCSWARSTAGGGLIAIQQGDHSDSILSISPDRRDHIAIVPRIDIGRVLSAALAPDASTLVITNHRQELLAVSLHDGAATLLDRSQYRPFYQLDISPDGSCCTYAIPLGMHRTAVRIAYCDGSGVVAESSPRFADAGPRFLHDGSVVYLSLQRHPASASEMVTRVMLWRAPFAPTDASTIWLNAPSGLFGAVAPMDCGIVLCDSGTDGEFQRVSQSESPVPVWRVSAHEVMTLDRERTLLRRGETWYRVTRRLGKFALQQIKLTGAVRTLRIDPRAQYRDAVAMVGRLVADEVPPALVTPDWPALREAYATLAQRACSAQDAMAIANELLGHLRLSHAHVSLRTQFTPAAANTDGRDVNCTGDRSAGRTSRYASWVNRREGMVRDATGDRVSYVHVPDVSDASAAALRDWRLCHEDARALILDLRFNEGGSRGGEMASFLTRPVLATIGSRWSVQRSVPESAGPVALMVLINKFTTSGGELLAIALREHASAVIIGEQSFGGAMGNTISHRLPGGLEVVLPQLMVTTPESWSQLENCGLVPDIVVKSHSPDAWPDPVIERALQEM